MKEEKIKAIIFDLDGVIVFTDKYHYQAWKKMADEIGVYFDEEINNRLRGVSRMDSLDIILEQSKKIYSNLEKLALAEQKNSTYRELLKGMTQEDVTDEVRGTLNYLKAKGCKIAIGSSSKNTKFILERVGLKDTFDAISDGTNISRSKPDPEVFLNAAEFLGVPACQCLVVEDAVAGIEAAHAGGMKAIGIGDASSYEKTDYPIHTFAQIKEIVCGRGE